MVDDIQYLLSVNPGEGEPIYKQLISQIERMVLSGTLKPGDMLPSVRQLALRFEVNPMTISKAYGLLEHSGVLERVRGKGMRVAQFDVEQQNESSRLERLMPVLESVVEQSKQLNIPSNIVLDKLQQLLEKS